MFSGSIVALATPFGPDGSVDQIALGKLVEFHVANGTAGLVIAGTTGESATLEKAEHADLIALAVELAGGRFPIIAGTGSNSTAQSVALTEACEKLGADGFLLVAPYYNKPTQEGLYLHFKAIADATYKPIILYNVPGRTCSDIAPATVGRLAAHERIVAIKDATGDMERLAENRAATPETFGHLSGDDFTALDFLLGGGSGVISVTANIAPRLMADLCAYAKAGDVDHARAVDARLQPLNQAMFVESNPIPVKYALNRMNMMSEQIRLPLTRLAEQYHEPVDNALRGAQLVDG